jgi:hypothetical protein
MSVDEFWPEQSYAVGALPEQSYADTAPKRSNGMASLRRTSVQRRRNFDQNSRFQIFVRMWAICDKEHVEALQTTFKFRDRIGPTPEITFKMCFTDFEWRLVELAIHITWKHSEQETGHF